MEFWFLLVWLTLVKTATGRRGNYVFKLRLESDVTLCMPKMGIREYNQEYMINW